MDQSNTAQANSKLKKKTAKEEMLTSDNKQIGSDGKSIPVATKVTGQQKTSDGEVTSTNNSALSTEYK